MHTDVAIQWLHQDYQLREEGTEQGRPVRLASHLDQNHLDPARQLLTIGHHLYKPGQPLTRLPTIRPDLQNRLTTLEEIHTLRSKSHL